MPALGRHAEKEVLLIIKVSHFWLAIGKPYFLEPFSAVNWTLLPVSRTSIVQALGSLLTDFYSDAIPDPGNR